MDLSREHPGRTAESELGGTLGVLGFPEKGYPGKTAEADVGTSRSILGTLHSGHVDGATATWLRPGCQGHCTSRVPDKSSGAKEV